MEVGRLIGSRHELNSFLFLPTEQQHANLSVNLRIITYISNIEIVKVHI
jgi:hypothetical protein